jgi:hypothetical protein
VRCVHCVLLAASGVALIKGAWAGTRSCSRRRRRRASSRASTPTPSPTTPPPARPAPPRPAPAEPAAPGTRAAGGSYRGASLARICRCGAPPRRRAAALTRLHATGVCLTEQAPLSSHPGYPFSRPPFTPFFPAARHGAALLTRFSLPSPFLPPLTHTASARLHPRSPIATRPPPPAVCCWHRTRRAAAAAPAAALCSYRRERGPHATAPAAPARLSLCVGPSAYRRQRHAGG